MKSNVSTTDKVIRLAAAAIILVLFLLDAISGTTAVILLIVAGILALTAFVGLCPLYSLLGIGSRKK